LYFSRLLGFRPCRSFDEGWQILASHVHSAMHVDLIRFRDPLCCAVLSASVLSAACTSTSTSATAPSADKCAVSASAAPLQFGASGGTGTLNIGAGA
jgi:hypothetical protein